MPCKRKRSRDINTHLFFAVQTVECTSKSTMHLHLPRSMLSASTFPKTLQHLIRIVISSKDMFRLPFQKIPQVMP